MTVMTYNQSKMLHLPEWKKEMFQLTTRGKIASELYHKHQPYLKRQLSPEEVLIFNVKNTLFSTGQPLTDAEIDRAITAAKDAVAKVVAEFQRRGLRDKLLMIDGGVSSAVTEVLMDIAKGEVTRHLVPIFGTSPEITALLVTGVVAFAIHLIRERKQK